MTRFSSMMMIALAITAIVLLPSVVHGQCTICADASQSFNSNKFVPAWNATCRELQFILSFAGDEALFEDTCAIGRQHAAWCECPGAELTCTFCPIGSEPVFPDLEIEGSNGTTCSDFNYFASIVPPDTPCDLFSDLAEFCGGCGDPAPTASPGDECYTLCPDGANAPNQDAIIFEDNAEVTTCGQFEALLSFFNPFESCPLVWYYGVSKCGCEDTLPLVPEGAICTLCEDGSAPPDPSFEIIPDYTCQGIGYFIANDEGNVCTATQATAGVYCGCENPVASQNACRICGDRLLPDASRIADPINQTFCGELEVAANFGEITCKEVQDTWAATCCLTDSPTSAPSKARVEDPTSDAANISINLATSTFLVGVVLLFVI